METVLEGKELIYSYSDEISSICNSDGIIYYLLS